MVEPTAVNRVVVGSSPTRGADPQALCLWIFLFQIEKVYTNYFLFRALIFVNSIISLRSMSESFSK